MVVIALGVKILVYLDLVPSINGHYHYIVETMRTFNNGTTVTKTYTVCGKENMEIATSILSYGASTASVTWDVTSTWYVPPTTTLPTPVA
jgi:hypothetical protein